MNEQEIVRRIRAYHEGRPLPRGETLHIHIAEPDDALIVSFLRMGGESRPWGVACGKPDQTPLVLSVPEARNRDLVSEMVVKLAPILLDHFRVPGQTATDPATWEDLLPLRQIWLPNSSHLDMLHHIAFAYAFTRYDPTNQDLLNAFGHLCGWLFREAQRPGQQSVMVGTTALRESFTFPSEQTRQGHLGFLLAWLDSNGDRAQRIATAMEAERTSISTSLDPEIERAELGPFVEEWGEARRASSTPRMNQLAERVMESLAPELVRRWELTETTFERLRTDRRRRNRGLPGLIEEGAKEQWYQSARLELKRNDQFDGPAYFPSIETDRYGAAAASRYFVHNASADQLESLLVHDDDELLAEVVAEGDAVQGEILHVWDDEPGRATRPVWVVRDTHDRQLRLRPGVSVSLVGMQNRTGRIRSIDEGDDGALEVEIEIDGLKTARLGATPPHDRHPASPGMRGVKVAFVKKAMDGISRRKSQMVWKRTGAGAWLTHASPSGPRATPFEDDQDDVAAVVAAGGS